MELYIQMGYGMQKLALELLDRDGPKTLILSPLNMTPTSIVAYAKEVTKHKGSMLLDPQVYSPRKYQKNLVNYSYFPKEDLTLYESGNCDSTICHLLELNEQIGTTEVILPSYYEKKIDDKWDFLIRVKIDYAHQHTKKPLYQTIALSEDVLQSEEHVQSIIAYVEKWDVAGVYIVCEHPGKYYLISQPLWVSNLMELVAALKRCGKKVIVGYASHQMLCLAVANCDAIATGNFLNVRWFKLDHFETIEDDQISRRAVWYYCPQALSEFKLPYLDIAKRMNLLDRLEPSPDLMNEYCKVLFCGAQPSSTAYTERNSHAHYICSLQKQCKSASRKTYKETLTAHQVLLETADVILKGLRNNGIRGQDRDFSDCVDVNRAAIASFDMAYGPALINEWK